MPDQNLPTEGEFGIKNFDRYQHYRFRRPTWIKLYASFLTDVTITALPLATQGVYVRLLLLASANGNVLPWNPREVPGLLQRNYREVSGSLRRLFNAGLIFTHDAASKALAECYNRDRVRVNTSNTLSTVPSSRTSLLPLLDREGGVGGEPPKPPLVLVPAKPVSKRAPRARFIPPTVAEVRTYVETQGFDVDPVNFCASYEAKGWLMGSTPMKNWKAAVVTWVRRQGGYDGNRQ